MNRALPIQAFRRRRSRREPTAPGLSGGRWSSNSGWQARSMGLLHLKKSAVAAKASAEGGHPPVAAWGRILKCSLQNKKDRGAAQIAILAKDSFAPAGIMLAQI